MLRYDITGANKVNVDGIVVSYKGEEIRFDVAVKLNGGSSGDELFEFLNIFFEGCAETKLDQLWNLLKEGKRVLEPGYFDNVDSGDLKELRERNSDYKFLIAKLQPILVKIYNVITPAEVGYAAKVTGRTKPPSDLMAMSRLGDYPEETTIDNDKYEELVKETFALQISFPLTAQLLVHLAEKMGRDYKEAVVGRMMASIPAITSMPGWRIMDTYVRASCLRKESRRNNVEVVSEAKYIDHAIYKGLFTKLCPSFIPSKIGSKNLSKELNSLVESVTRPNGNVIFKSYTDPKPGSDEQSIPESYRINQAVNGTDELAQAEYFTFDLYYEVQVRDALGDLVWTWEKKNKNFFKYQCLGFDIKNQALAERLFNTLPRIWNFRLTQIHTKLLQLVYMGHINYNLYPALSYDQLMAAICLAQVKLYEMGFERLASLCSIVRNPDHPISFLNDDFKLSTKEREQLTELCDIYTGQNVSSAENVLIKSVTDFLGELSTSGWDSTIEPGLLGNEKYVSLMASGHFYEVDLVPEIKKELIELIVLSHTVEAAVEEE